MTKSIVNDSWAGGPAYERFMGRWSRLIAKSFIKWLAPRPNISWLDIGCGTGALSETILSEAAPKSILAVDPSAQFIEFAKLKLPESHVTFHIGEAVTVPHPSQGFNMAVSGLAFNFIPEPVAALQAMRKALAPNGVLAFYVWDYSGKMEMLRVFWDSVIALDPRARSLDEGIRFPLCQPDTLRQLCEDANLRNIELTGLEALTVFQDFDDYWSPFLGGQGPAPSYVSQLDAASRLALEEHLRTALPFQQDGSIHLVARAWAVKTAP